MKQYLSLTIILLLILQVSLCSGFQEESQNFSTAIEQLKNHQYGQNAEQLKIIDETVLRAQTDNNLRRDVEEQFIEFLEADATVAGKKYICEKLSLIGSAKAIPVLGELLENDELNHMALFALGRISDPAVNRVLLEKLPEVKGMSKVGIMNLLGILKDQEAIPELSELITDSDKKVASAAIYNLGMIGSAEAAEALNDNLSGTSSDLKSEILNAQLRIAENFQEENNNEEALKIYTQLFENSQSAEARLAGFAGLVKLQPQEKNQMLLDALAGDENELRGYAAQTIADLPPGTDLSDFLKSLGKLPPAGQQALVRSFALRKESRAREFVLSLLDSDNIDLQIEVLRALGEIGTSEDALMLAKIAANPDHAGNETARLSLAKMDAVNTNTALVSGLQMATPALRIEIISSLANRGAIEKSPAILPYLSDPDENVRLAGLGALERLGNENDIPLLIEIVKETENSKEKEAADKALTAILSRVGEKGMPAVQDAYHLADASFRIYLMSLMPLIGGEVALNQVRSTLKSENPEMKDASIRAIAKWPDESAMEDLKDIAENGEQQNHRILAFRGYIRLIRIQENPRRPKSRTLRRTMFLAERPEEQKLVLAAFSDLSTIRALKCAERYMYDENIAEEACATVLNIAGQVDRKYKIDIGLALIQVLNIAESEQTIRGAKRLLSRRDIDPEKLLGQGSSGKASKKIVFLAGPMDHAPFPGGHDYIRDLVLLKRYMETASNIEPLDIELYIGTKPDLEILKGAKTLVVHSSADRLLGEYHALFPSFHEEYTEEFTSYLKEVDKLVDQGMGIVIFHYGLWTDKPQSRDYMNKWIGGYFEDEYSEVKLDDFGVEFPTPDHPVMNGCKPWFGREEYYFLQRLMENDPRRTPLVTCDLDSATQDDVIGWSVQRDTGRGIGFTGCHAHTMMMNEDFSRFVMNAVLWTAGINVPEEGVISKVPEDWDAIEQPN